MDEKSAFAAAEKVTPLLMQPTHRCNSSFQADKIRVKVGYPSSPDTKNPHSLLRYYALVDISKFDYFKNMLSARYGTGTLLSYVTNERDQFKRRL